MNPRINRRDLPSPLTWGSARPGMSWHHIVPFSLLRDVWNILVDNFIASDSPEARTALRQYLSLADRSLPNIDSLIDRIRAKERPRAAHSPLPELSVAEANQLGTAAVWPAWNAVEGPKNRSDDPHDRYFDRFTSGLTPEELVRMRAIESLYAALRSFVAGGPRPGTASLRSLAQAASIARPILVRDLPIRFRPEMWVQDGGLWRKARDGAVD